MKKILAQLLIFTYQWIFAKCLPDIVIMSHTPVVRDAQLTILVCKDLSGTLSKGSLSIRRQFQWGGSTGTESSTSGPAWNNTAVSESWVGEDTDKAIGGFGCVQGHDAVSVVKMHLNSTLVPVKFSMTSSVGSKVVLKMESRLPDGNRKVTWSKDGHTFSLRGSTRKWELDGGKSLVITEIEEEDAGIYMALYDDEEVKYAAGTILNVRRCPMNKWSVNCSKTCPVCRNGGVCDERTGDCSCLPGFRGTRCEEACLPSSFGRECEHHCRDIGLGETNCRGIQHCSLLGCFCFNGWTGLACTEVCPAGSYGAGCDMKCNCGDEGRCDRFSGCVCNQGFTGSSCELSDSGIADSSNGTSSIPFDPSQVDAGQERIPVIRNITASPSWKVNVKEKVTISCSVTGNPAPGHGQISLEWKNGLKLKLTSSKMADAYTTTSQFEHMMTSYPGPFWCVAKTSVGQARKEFFFDIQVKPRPLLPPEVLENKVDYLKLKLNSNHFTGDGPINLITLLYKKTEDDGLFMQFPKKIVNDTAVLTNLEPYTNYTFRVLLGRPGPQGLGYPGPEAYIKTFCKYPRKPPTIKNIYAKNDTILYISWSLPPKIDIGGEVLGYKIRYKILGDDSKWTYVDLAYSSKASTTLDNMTPLAVYSVRILLYNCAGNGVESEPVRVTMGRLETPVGPNVSLVNKTSRSAAFEWLPPSNAKSYTISDYEAAIQRVGSDDYVLLVNNSNPGIIARNLTPYTDYVFKVRAFNHEGPGNYSEEIQFQTEQEAPGTPSNFRVAQITISSIELAWNQPEQPNGIIEQYLLSYKSQDDDGNWTLIDTGKANTYTIEYLKEYHDYEFKIKAVTISPGNWTQTMNQKTMTSSPLLPPSDIHVQSKSPQSVLISWNPPPPSAYVHKIRSYKISYTDDMRQKLEHWNSKFVSGDQQNIIVDQLRPYTVYLFAIAAVTLKTGKFSEQGTFRTESLTIPPAPSNVRFMNVTAMSALVQWEVASGYDVTSVQMRWKSMSAPEWNILHFPRNVYSITLSTLQAETYYNIELTAFNSIGQSVAMTTHFKTIKAEDVPANDWTAILGWAVGGLVLVSVLLILIVCCVRKRCIKQDDGFEYSHEMTTRGKIQRQSTIGSSFNAGGINTRSNTLLSSHSTHSVNSKTVSNCDVAVAIPQHMILPWESIFFEDITLGEGNFGQVVKAIIQIEDKCINAAVKTLKDGCSMDDRKDFLAELDMMIRLGKHPNIISLIGACEHNSSLYLCTEFAPNGNLLQYLRKSRNIGGEATYTYLTQGQLLQFALDICQGMSFLSEQELIHRDLAARNILLSADRTCKVADFGLSRGEGVYVKRTVARLPIRWMAIESLNYNVYTTQSDVWSFGVVLWEIVSLGGTPYYGMSCAELYEKLPKGYRMEQPMNCDAEIYKLMCQCWKDRPHERPSFPQLSVALKRMIEVRTDVNYVNTALFENFSFFKIDANEEEED